MMARITIELEQSCERLMRREGRLLHFPDGIGRIVSLPRRNWLMYDQLAGRWVYPGAYEDKCYELAGQYGDPGEEAFEDAIGYLFGLAIETGMNLLLKEQYRPVNSN